MVDPERGLRELVRVTREGGVVAACVCDHGSGQESLSLFREVAHELDDDVQDESRPAERAPATSPSSSAQQDCVTSRRARSSSSSSTNASTPGGRRSPLASPGGKHVAGLDEQRRAELRTGVASDLEGPFVLPGRAAARGIAG